MYDRMAEQQIQRAIKEGVLDDLPGAGKPLPPDALEGLGPEERAEALAIRAGGIVPPEVEALRELEELRARAEAAEGPARAALEAEIAAKRTKLSMLFERTGRFLSARIAEGR